MAIVTSRSGSSVYAPVAGVNSPSAKAEVQCRLSSLLGSRDPAGAGA
jgi:hypothetical protein